MKTLSSSSLALLYAALVSTPILFSNYSMAQTPRGSLGIDAVYFPEDPLFPDQSDELIQPSLFGSVDWSSDISRDLRFDLSAFLRIAPDAQKQISGDVRQAVVLSRLQSFDFKLGILQENWRILEAWSPVDIVNQRDMVEDFQGKVKLGQPGISVSTFYNDLNVSALVLPYTRERRIAEQDDRLRTLPAPIIDSHFENGQSDTAYALRLQYRLGDLDLGLSQFWGHSREPVYQPIIEQSTVLGFDELYQHISQTGVALQYVWGDSVLKAEAIYQTGSSDEFSGGGIGAETTFNQISNGFDSITFYVEAYYDARNDPAPLTPFQRDVFVGLRYNTNDVNDSLLDVRYTRDIEFHSELIDIRASRRFGSSQIISAQLLLPLATDDDPALFGFQQDRYFKLSWDWYW